MVTNYCILPKHSMVGANEWEKKTQYLPPFSLQSNLAANTVHSTIQGAIILSSQMSTPLKNFVFFFFPFFGGGSVFVCVFLVLFCFYFFLKK